MTTKHQKRRGAAVIIAMVLILIIGAIATMTVKEICRDRMVFRQNLVKQQTEQLVEDAAARTVLQLAEQPDYTGETILLKELPFPIPGTLELAIQVVREEEKIIVTGLFVEDFSDRKICDIQKNFDFSGKMIVEEPVFSELPVEDMPIGDPDGNGPLFGEFDDEDDPFASSENEELNDVRENTPTSETGGW